MEFVCLSIDDAVRRLIYYSLGAARPPALPPWLVGLTPRSLPTLSDPDKENPANPVGTTTGAASKFVSISDQPSAVSLLLV